MFIIKLVFLLITGQKMWNIFIYLVIREQSDVKPDPCKWYKISMMYLNTYRSLKMLSLEVQLIHPWIYFCMFHKLISNSSLFKTHENMIQAYLPLYGEVFRKECPIEKKSPFGKYWNCCRIHPSSCMFKEWRKGKCNVKVHYVCKMDIIFFLLIQI